MANLESFVSDMKVMAEGMGRKAEELMELSRLRLERVTLKSDIQKNYAKIGELVYKGRRTGEDNDAILEICIEELTEQHVRLSEIAEKIASLKNMLRCRACGAINPPDAEFCIKCGEKFARETIDFTALPGVEKLDAEDAELVKEIRAAAEAPSVTVDAQGHLNAEV